MPQLVPLFFVNQLLDVETTEYIITIIIILLGLTVFSLMSLDFVLNSDPQAKPKIKHDTPNKKEEKIQLPLACGQQKAGSYSSAGFNHTFLFNPVVKDDQRVFNLQTVRQVIQIERRVMDSFSKQYGGSISSTAYGLYPWAEYSVINHHGKNGIWVPVSNTQIYNFKHLDGSDVEIRGQEMFLECRRNLPS